MKKFYKLAEAGTAPGGHVVRLDGKVIKTPLKHNLILPSAALAQAVAAEWAAQGDEIVPPSMPLTQLANTMLDKSAGHERSLLEEQVYEYGASDLVCYFADRPQSLIARQEKHWKPLLDWMKEDCGVVLEPVTGIQYHHQPKESLNKLELLIEALDAKDFTVLQAAAGVTGSAIIAFALARRKITAQEAYEAACVDELFQM
jgi:chaperone required for assembly of F1-ATPase